MNKHNSKAAIRQQDHKVVSANLFTPPVQVRDSLANTDLLLHPAPHPLRDAVFQQLQLLNAPLLRARNMAASGMISNELGYKRTAVPAIRISGKWLHAAGFTQMDRYFLYAYEGMIILVPQGPPPSPAARQSWYESPGIGRKRKKSVDVIEMESLSGRYQGAIATLPDHNHY